MSSVNGRVAQGATHTEHDQRKQTGDRQTRGALVSRPRRDRARPSTHLDGQLSTHRVITDGEAGADLVDPRRCTHVRNDGTRCKGWKMSGSDFCAGHTLGFGRGSDPREAASKSAEVRKGHAQARSEARQAARRRPQDVYRDALVAHAEELAARLLDIATNGSDADALRAIEALNSRVLGRPTERIEVDASVPDSVEAIRRMSSAERQALLVQLEQGAGLAQVLPMLRKGASAQGEQGRRRLS
jgi:hypothetical protein